MKSKLFTSPNTNEPSTQKELAESYGITQQSMNNYMRMACMIPELEDLVDTGIVTKDTALAIIKNLSNDEQKELISSMVITKKITKKETQKYIDEIKSLAEQKDFPTTYMAGWKVWCFPQSRYYRKDLFPPFPYGGGLTAMQPNRLTS